jgi:bacteriorhodopsin
MIFSFAGVFVVFLCLLIWRFGKIKSEKRLRIVIGVFLALCILIYIAYVTVGFLQTTGQITVLD